MFRLYLSPVVKSKSCDFLDSNGRKQSPQEWVTDELEHPRTPQLASAKKNILYKLDGSLDSENRLNICSFTLLQ